MKCWRGNAGAEELRYFCEHGRFRVSLAPFVILPGPHGYSVQLLGVPEAAIRKEYKAMLTRLCPIKHLWCLPEDPSQRLISLLRLRKERRTHESVGSRISRHDPSGLGRSHAGVEFLSRTTKFGTQATVPVRFPRIAASACTRRTVSTTRGLIRTFSLLAAARSRHWTCWAIPSHSPFWLIVDPARAGSAVCPHRLAATWGRWTLARLPGCGALGCPGSPRPVWRRGQHRTCLRGSKSADRGAASSGVDFGIAVAGSFAEQEHGASHRTGDGIRATAAVWDGPP